MKQYPYKDLKHYREAQTAGNKRKLSMVWVREETIAHIATLAARNTGNILCHGTRNGAEQRMFKTHFPGAYVIGTEISDTAKQFKDTVEHDFHDQKKEWVGRFDVVYSNSIDHSHSPLLALQTWGAQLAPGGRLFVEFGVGEKVNVCSETDPLQIAPDELEALMFDAGLLVTRVFDAAGVKGEAEHASVVFVAEKR